MKRGLLILAALAALLAGCATGPATTPEAPRADTPAKAPAVAAFERRQREAAEAAAAQGRFAEALLAWDTVLALSPQDGAAAARRAEVQTAASATAADRLARARAAQQKGDNELAARLYLEVLAITPDTSAADALREIERQRTRRGNVVGFRAAAVLQPKTVPLTGAERADVEHASMLAAQGEVDAAIAVLEPVASRKGADPAARNDLADLYVRQADRLQAKDRAAAIVALERALALVPGHKAATAKMRALR